VGLSKVILIENRFIVGDKDQLEPPTLHWKSILRLAFHTTTVPGMKSLFIDLPSCNKGIPVCHNILTFMAIKIVTILTGRTPDSAVMTTRAGKYH
jgi:hypothetical protein